MRWGVLAGKLAVVVALDVDPILGKWTSGIGRFRGPERAGEVVAEVEEARDAPALEVGDDLLEGGEVAVDVGEEGERGHNTFYYFRKRNLTIRKYR